VAAAAAVAAGFGDLEGGERDGVLEKDPGEKQLLLLPGVASE